MEGKIGDNVFPKPLAPMEGKIGDNDFPKPLAPMKGKIGEIFFCLSHYYVRCVSACSDLVWEIYWLGNSCQGGGGGVLSCACVTRYIQYVYC